MENLDGDRGGGEAAVETDWWMLIHPVRGADGGDCGVRVVAACGDDGDCGDVTQTQVAQATQRRVWAHGRH